MVGSYEKQSRGGDQKISLSYQPPEPAGIVVSSIFCRNRPQIVPVIYFYQAKISKGKIT
jgi:hypothetical protein